MIRMRDVERLELLKEIAGTRTYDERKKESLKIMKDTDNRLDQIEEVIKYLDKRLRELESEKKELSEYLSLDGDRRAAEYSLYNQQYKAAHSKLEALEKDKSKDSSKFDETHKELDEATKIREKKEEEFDQTRLKIDQLNGQKAKIAKERGDLLSKQAQIKAAIEAAQSRASSGKKHSDEAAKELKSVEKELTSTQKKLETVKEGFSAKAAAEDELKTRLAALKQRLTDLYAKQGRANKFSNKKERDAELRNKLKQLQQQIKAIEKQLSQLEKTNSALFVEKSRAGEVISKANSEISALRERVDALNGEIQRVELQRNEEFEKRKDIQREEAEIASEFGVGLGSELEKWRRELESTMDNEIRKGLLFIEKIRSEGNIKGIHGPLIELFDCPVQQFHKPVEVVAGNSLFNIVVDTDDIAAQLIKELNKNKSGGRITFIPLNRLDYDEPSYPSNTVDVIPMLSKLSFKPVYRPAMLQVFGSHLVARDLAVAHSFSANFNCITISGDRIDKKGAVTGGYVEFRVSRLECQQRINSSRAGHAQRQQQKTKLQAEMAKLDSIISKFNSQLEGLHEEKKKLRATFAQCELEIKAARSEIASNEETMKKNDKLLRDLKNQLESLHQEEKSLTQELHSELAAELSREDKEEINSLMKEIADLEEELIELSKERAAVEAEVNKLEAAINQRLIRRKDELSLAIQSRSVTEDGEELVHNQLELQRLTAQVKAIETQMNKTVEELEKLSETLNKLQNQVDKLKHEEIVLSVAAAETSKVAEKYVGRRQNLIRKKDEATRKIRDLGSLPSEVEKYSNKSADQLINILEKLLEKLKKYGHVNKKALDQFSQFTEQKLDLDERKQELSQGRQSILELIQHLDNKKDEAINRTFKQIARNFSEVFAELVPGGKATLVLLKRKESKDAEEDSEAEELAEKDGAGEFEKQYIGVGIKVAFPGGATAKHQLSGGQESVVALSLIFAIQRCDPSPFYLFDEVDAALDPAHRTALANMIAKEKRKEVVDEDGNITVETTQFITTTFSPEFLHKADKFYGVIFQNKVSKVSVISRGEALELIAVEERSVEERKEIE
jgi:structural maintenance of chromosome 3 (chondroitin sulfate proteoglycan 6)